MGRFDPTADETRTLWESGNVGGLQQCRVALKGRNLRRAARGARTIGELREIVLAIIDGVYPPDP